MNVTNWLEQLTNLPINWKLVEKYFHLFDSFHITLKKKKEKKKTFAGFIFLNVRLCHLFFP